MTFAIEVHSPEYVTRLQHRQGANHQKIWTLLDQVKDPEIPVVSLWDLGILQDIKLLDNTVTVTITPTYSGCPAMLEISSDIKEILLSTGYSDVIVETRLIPAWTTDWMSSEGRKQLREYGIAPPRCMTPDAQLSNIQCPQCNASNVKLISEFGSTSCKALYQCNSCLEPFDYFKCI
jgi:ring-1,2-phenylacetyl-CoA epoxidase subunit PaaD